MSKRSHMAALPALVLTLTFTLAPLPALADEAPAPSTTQSTGDAATQLGPSGSGGGGSNADGGVLQPAGLSPLQSTTHDSTGLTAPSSEVLQAPVTGDAALQVLAGEGEGASRPPADIAPGGPWGWIWFSLLFGLLAAGAGLLYRRFVRRRRPLAAAGHHHTASAPAKPDADTIESEPAESESSESGESDAPAEAAPDSHAKPHDHPDKTD